MNEIRASQAKPNRTASLERKVLSTFKSALQIQDRSSPASIIIGVFEMVQFCLNWPTIRILKNKFQKQRELFPKTFYSIWLRTVTCLLCAFAGSKAPVF